MSTTMYARATIKTAPTDGSGYVSAYLATWAIDRDNERFAKGAFAASILRWDASGQTPPVLWEHDTSSPNNVIGSITKMQENDEGLLVSIQLDLNNPTAVAVYERLLAGTLNTMSIGFSVEATHIEPALGKSVKMPSVAPGTVAAGDLLVIDRADIVEGSFTPVPANPDARVLQVKGNKASTEPGYWLKKIDGDRVVSRDPAALLEQLDAADAFVDGSRFLAEQRRSRQDADAWLENDRRERAAEAFAREQRAASGAD